MNKISFTIIIPHKNLPHLLQRCIDSIPYRDDTEIIIVDDNSDPDKVDFEKFPGSDRPEVKIIFDKKGLGAGAARNIGLKEAKGKWLLFADSDDTYTTDLNKLLDKYKNSIADIVYFKANIISESSNKCVFIYMNYYIDKFLRTKEGLDDIKYGAWEPWNKMINHHIVKSNNLRFDEISSSNDKMFSLRLGVLIRKIEVSPIICYNYILRKGSIIHSGKENRFKNSFYIFLNQNSLYHKVKYNRKEFIPFFLLCNYKQINKKIIKDYIEYLRKTKANPFEGFINSFLFRIIRKINYSYRSTLKI